MLDGPRAISVDRVDVEIIEELKLWVRSRLRVSNGGGPGRDSDHSAKKNSVRNITKIFTRVDDLIDLPDIIFRTFNQGA